MSQEHQNTASSLNCGNRKSEVLALATDHVKNSPGPKTGSLEQLHDAVVVYTCMSCSSARRAAWGPAFRHDAVLIFHEFNLGKRSVTLDLPMPAGLKQPHALLEHSDILVHNPARPRHRAPDAPTECLEQLNAPAASSF